METHTPLTQVSPVRGLFDSVKASLVPNCSAIARLFECLLHADPGLTLYKHDCNSDSLISWALYDPILEVGWLRLLEGNSFP